MPGSSACEQPLRQACPGDNAPFLRRQPYAGTLAAWTNRRGFRHFAAVKVIILSYADVSGAIAATLIGRGHEVMFLAGGGAAAAEHGALLGAVDGYDGCLLLGEAPEFAAFAGAFRDRGKMIWRDWTDIPPTRPVSIG